ncbi:uncharacterized protein LOC109842484 [Asparagus officinalis]|uniref:uncharacterized protein LOC109842484 n=1 Tax=Asparagus officinalis TaxID=4686 RepID=UPI00098DEF73|nr:uncharacterized protein LOC109842484 [Asparagus officinalis]
MNKTNSIKIRRRTTNLNFKENETSNIFKYIFPNLNKQSEIPHQVNTRLVLGQGKEAGGVVHVVHMQLPVPVSSYEFNPWIPAQGTKSKLSGNSSSGFSQVGENPATNTRLANSKNSGLNKPSKQLMIKQHLQLYHLPFISLLETKIKESNIKDAAKRIAKEWDWLSNVNNSEKARIFILWDPNILSIQQMSLSSQQITCKVNSIDGRLSCIISSVYGYNNIQDRKSLWEELTLIHRSVGNLPWIICGDFNAMVDSGEKLGGSTLTDADTIDFRSFIDDCQLTHLKTIGCFFTWNNKQDKDSRVWSRLDRTLVNDNWIQHINSSHVEYMVPRLSDHSPAIVSVYDDPSYGKKPFRFFNMWTKHDDFSTTVSSIWQTHINGFHMYSVYSKLKMLKGALKSLNRRHFGNISEQVIRAKTEMEKARTAWYIQGDRNSKLFHSAIKNNRHNNRVQVLYNSQGDRITDGEEIIKEFISYYKNLMGTAIPTVKTESHVIQNGTCLSPFQVSDLSKPVTSDEIRSAIFSMSDNKAPGPDGLAVIGSLVNEAQSAFVKGRQISNNILLAHELVKNYGRKHLSPRVMINIDIRKAFDSISWDFLQDIMTGLGFPLVFVKWIMSCISSPNYSVSLNGSLHGFFKGGRGLRQGDPLSPYLFILDDLLLFCKGDSYSVNKLFQCVKSFGDCSGLEANPSKCSIFYGGVSEDTKQMINNSLGFCEGKLPIRYLGLPLICKRMSFIDCNPLLLKISNQFQSCMKNKNLSYAGRIQIIKSVILGVQIFWTSSYILPVKVLQKIDELCRSFLWGKSDQTFKSALVSWSKVCVHKKNGGLGIFSARLWNTAAALKILWSIHMNKEQLWIKWSHENYIKNSSIWHINPKKGDSWMWKQLLKIRDKCLELCGGTENLKQLINSCCVNSKVQISSLYSSLSPDTTCVAWHNTVWENLSIPKHSFTLWLAVNDKLQTQDRLLKHGIIQASVCKLCDGPSESRNHLFFECKLSNYVWNGIMEWLKFKWRSCNWTALLNWYSFRLRGNGIKQKIKRMALAAAVYNIWKERNNRIFTLKNRSPDVVLRNIKMDILVALLNNSPSDEDRLDSLLALIYYRGGAKQRGFSGRRLGKVVEVLADLEGELGVEVPEVVS